MKKRLFAVLMAVCLVLSTCVLFASAATNYKSGSYLIGDDSALKIAKDGTDYNVALTVSKKSNATLPIGTTTLSASDIDAVFTFKAGTKTVKYEGTLDKYITITATVDAAGTTVTIDNIEQKSAGSAYVVKTAFDDETPIAYTACKDYLEEGKTEYNLYDDADVLEIKGTTNSVKLVAKLHSLTTGVRFFGSTYNNLVASEIAKVTANVERQVGGASTVTISATNKIEDLMTGDKVTLTAALKDEAADGEFYGFYCWVDGSGTVLSTAKTITWTAGSSTSAIYATFVELKNRVEIDYSAGENGSILYNESREIFKGDGQISVMEGRTASFTFVPDEGYEVASVIIDGEKNIASLKNIDFSALLDDIINGTDNSGIRDLINATNKEVYSYTFSADQLAYENGNHSIVVTFQKIAALEAPTGKDLPTVAPEGITLATGVAGEEADGEGSDATTVPAENNGSNGASDGIVNPQTGSASAVAVFAVLSVAAGAAFVTSKKKN